MSVRCEDCVSSSGETACERLPRDVSKPCCPGFLHRWAIGKVFYLASPYTSADPLVREARYHQALDAAAVILSQGAYVYSPIAHTHPIATRHDLPKGFEFWAGYDHALIDRCDALLVLEADGCSESVGVTAEIAYARSRRIPVFYLECPCRIADFHLLCALGALGMGLEG